MINVLSCVTDKDSRVFVAIGELREDIKTVKILLGSLINASAPLLTENVFALPEHTFPLTIVSVLQLLSIRFRASIVEKLSFKVQMISTLFLFVLCTLFFDVF